MRKNTVLFLALFAAFRIDAQDSHTVAWMRGTVEVHGRSAMSAELEADVRRRHLQNQRPLDERQTESLRLWIRHRTGDHVVLSISPAGYFHEAESPIAGRQQESRHIFRSSAFAAWGGACCKFSLTSRAGNDLLHDLKKGTSASRLRLRETVARQLSEKVSLNLSDELFLQYDRVLHIPQNRVTGGIRTVIHGDIEVEAGYIRQWLFLKYPYRIHTNGIYVNFTVHRKHTT